MLLRFLLSLSLLLPSPIAFSVPLLGHKMMVATPTPLSAQLSEEIIKKGGNVVDVAVAIALILSVTNPRHAALGGGGFALVKMGKDPVQALDFRETAPEKTHSKYFVDKKTNASRDGAHAIGVPGMPAGLWALHKKYGKLHWSVLFDQPIKLAKDGHALTGENVERTTLVMKDFNQAGKKYFLNPKGQVYKPGEILKQPQLAKALKEMRNRGPVPFYQGDIGRDIVQTVQKEGGVLSLKDLRDYKVRWLKPVISEYAGYKLYLMPPPSSGGLIIASSLKMLEKLETQKLEPLSTLEFHYFAEVMKVNFRNRSLLGDPDFVKNPVDEFLNAEKISHWVQQIKPDQILKLEPLKDSEIKESDQTTHFTVMDAQGNAVAMTVTLNGVFGSRVVSDKYGIALNNEMDDFTTLPGQANLYELMQGKANSVEAGKRPLSSMSPTFVEKNKKIVMALGAPGGPRIITAVLQTIYRVLTNGYNMEEAIRAPRVHHQFLPNTVFIDSKRLPPLSIEELKKKGHTVEEGWGARVNGVRINEKGFLEAAYDDRSEGGAAGF